MSLQEKLAKIKSPNLQNQQHTRVVLTSIEETLQERGTEFTPTAYFAALLALVRQSGSAPTGDNGSELITSTFYLLDLLSAYVPPPLLRAQYSQISALLSPVIAGGQATASLLKSVIGCLEYLLLAQDSAAWSLSSSQAGPRQVIPLLLRFALDERPKIRKRSLEALRNVLRSKPQGPALDHPAAELCASITLVSLKEAINSASQSKKTKGRNDDGHDPALIHALQLAKTMAAACGGWPSRNIEPLVDTLMAISKSTNEYLVVGAFEVFEAIFEDMQDEVSSTKLPRLLDAIKDLKPLQNDSQVLPPWFAVLSRGYQVASQVMPEDTFATLPDLVDMIIPFLAQSSHNIRVSASECLISLFSTCIPKSAVLEPSMYDEKIFEHLGSKAKDLLSLKYQSAWMEVFNTLPALIEAMRWQGAKYLSAVVETVGELRGKDSFQGKKEADRLLGCAIQHAGPDFVLSILPHNLDQGNSKNQGRAWLLPLLRDHVANTRLSHFKSDLMPLSENIYQLVIEHGEAEKTPRIKVYETIVHQIWATLPGYCDLPLDLTETVDQPFAELISNLLYQQADLRVDLCRGLRNLVESNQAIGLSDLEESDLLYEPRTTKAQAVKNLEHLANVSSNLLAVLFNVYSQTVPQRRGYILECINAYLSITKEQDLTETYTRVSTMLDVELAKKDEVAKQTSKDKIPPTSHTLLDLIITISIYLPRTTFATLFSLASRLLNHSTLSKSDPQLIKKTYKLIPRLSTSSTGASALEARHSELQSLILATSEQTPVPARRDRLLTISTLIAFLPTSDLHFIPSILGEIVIACKDGNQRAREAGFDALIAATERLTDTERNPDGTLIKNHLVPHMADDAPNAPATLEEVFTMVSAGLAGVAPHMVAATIIALARLTYEYHSRLNRAVLEDMVGTVELFLQSNNREIVRAVLGFVKVVIVSLPVEMMTDQRMALLMKGCMVWSDENKGRMRMKVKGILERSIRKFGADQVERWMGDDEGGKKFVVNIRKRKERAKRKKNGKDQDDSEEESGQENGGKREFDNEFDRAVYGSDDDSDMVFGSDGELEDNSNDHKGGISLKGKPSKASKKSTQQTRFIRADNDSDDEPLDLLAPSALASISSRRHPTRLPESAQTKRRGKTRINEDGKLVFGTDGDVAMGGTGSAEQENGRNQNGDQGQGQGVSAYVDAISGPDAVRRGVKGRLKIGNAGMANRKRSRDESGGIGVADTLSEQEAREVGRQLSANSPSSRNRAGSRGGQARRGLGVEKTRGVSQGNGRVMRRGSGGRGGGMRGGRGGRGGSGGSGRGNVRFGDRSRGRGGGGIRR